MDDRTPPRPVSELVESFLAHHNLIVGRIPQKPSKALKMAIDSERDAALAEYATDNYSNELEKAEELQWED